MDDSDFKIEALAQQASFQHRRARDAEHGERMLGKHLFEACKIIEENNLLAHLSKAVADWFEKDKAQRDGSFSADLQSVSMEILRNGFPPRNEQGH